MNPKCEHFRPLDPCFSFSCSIYEVFQELGARFEALDKRIIVYEVQRGAA